MLGILLHDELVRRAAAMVLLAQPLHPRLQRVQDFPPVKQSLLPGLLGGFRHDAPLLRRLRVQRLPVPPAASPRWHGCLNSMSNLRNFVVRAAEANQWAVHRLRGNELGGLGSEFTTDAAVVALSNALKTCPRTTTPSLWPWARRPRRIPHMRGGKRDHLVPVIGISHIGPSLRLKFHHHR